MTEGAPTRTPGNVIENVWIRDLNATTIGHYFSTPLQYMYTPLVYLSYAIDFQLGGLDPTAYHVTNLLLPGQHGRGVRRLLRADAAGQRGALRDRGVRDPPDERRRRGLDLDSRRPAGGVVLAVGAARVHPVRGHRTTMASRGRGGVVPVRHVLQVARGGAPARAVPRGPLPPADRVAASAGQRREAAHREAPVPGDRDHDGHRGTELPDRHRQPVRVHDPGPVLHRVRGPRGVHRKTALPVRALVRPRVPAEERRVPAVVPLPGAGRPGRRDLAARTGDEATPHCRVWTVVLLHHDHLEPDGPAPRQLPGQPVRVPSVPRTVPHPRPQADLLINGKATRRRLPQVRTAGPVALLAVAMVFASGTFTRNRVWHDTISVTSNSIDHEPDVAFVHNSRGIARYRAGDYAGARGSTSRRRSRSIHGSTSATTTWAS
jgi:hypothetical protein